MGSTSVCNALTRMYNTCMNTWYGRTSNPERTKIHCRLVIVKLRSHKNTRERARSTQKIQGIRYYELCLARQSDSANHRKRGKFPKNLSRWS